MRPNRKARHAGGLRHPGIAAVSTVTKPWINHWPPLVGMKSATTVLINAVYWPVVLIGLLLALTSFYHVVLPHRLPWRG